MIKLDENTKKLLIELQKAKRVSLEGNILKVIDAGDDEEFKQYIKDCVDKDMATRKKRLEITKQIQSQNGELLTAQEENAQLLGDLRTALETAENAKNIVEQDLDILQKKTQTELIGTIVRVALWIVVGVGIVTTLIYGVSLATGVDTTLIGNTWSNMLGILLTNSFSIVGTIMGVKYATEGGKS